MLSKINDVNLKKIFDESIFFASLEIIRELRNCSSHNDIYGKKIFILCGDKISLKPVFKDKSKNYEFHLNIVSLFLSIERNNNFRDRFEEKLYNNKKINSEDNILFFLKKKFIRDL